MIACAWGAIPTAALEPLYADERRRWLAALRWDPGPSWAEVEHARLVWGLPGFVAVDAGGRLRGLAFYLQEGDRIDIGGLSAASAEATDCLLDALVTAAAATDATTVRILALDAAATLSAGLRLRGFSVESHFYLSRDLAGVPSGGSFAPRAAEPVSAEPSFAVPGVSSMLRGADPAINPAVLTGLTRIPSRPVRAAAGTAPRGVLDTWRTGDEEAAAALLSRAYDWDAATLFAPHHEPGEWRRYVHNLVTHVGCGAFSATHSRVLRDDAALLGLALITDIGPRTAHLVQLAVDSSMRGQRVGASLLAQVCASLGSDGYAALTLMVAQGNAAARALYDRAGFRHHATFVSGTLRLHLRSTLRRAI